MAFLGRLEQKTRPAHPPRLRKTDPTGRERGIVNLTGISDCTACLSLSQIGDASTLLGAMPLSGDQHPRFRRLAASKPRKSCHHPREPALYYPLFRLSKSGSRRSASPASSSLCHRTRKWVPRAGLTADGFGVRAIHRRFPLAAEPPFSFLFRRWPIARDFFRSRQNEFSWPSWHILWLGAGRNHNRLWLRR
jgi:hypothetical protein